MGNPVGDQTEMTVMNVKAHTDFISPEQIKMKIPEEIKEEDERASVVSENVSDESHLGKQSQKPAFVKQSTINERPG